MAAARRLLLSAAGGLGHLRPLLPLAEEAARQGYDVLITGAASLAPHAAARRLAFAPTGPDLRPLHRPLVVHDVDEERRAVGSYFVERLGRERAAALLELCRSWRPDVVIRDEVDFGAAVAAEAAVLPHVAVVVIGAGGFILPAMVAAPLGRLREEHDLDPAVGLAMLHRHLTLTPFPASFRDPADPLPGRVLGYRVPAAAAPPRATAGRRVLVTLGTIFNTESDDLLRTAALGAAASRGVERVVVTTGEHVDPATLGPLPGHVEVHRFVPQDRVVAGCDAVVSHAGSGTVLDALKHGLPTVSLPMGADQHLNAARLSGLGLGLSLAADTATPEQVRDAVEQVLTSTSIRPALDDLAREIDALADVHEAVRMAAELAGRRS